MSHNSSAAFALRGLQKSYTDFRLGPLDIELEPGTVAAFVGPNGSGKTTTLNCMVGLILPDHGEVEIFGRPAVDEDVSWKHDIGYVGSTQGFYRGWTAARNLDFISRFYPRWSQQRVQELARRFELPLDKKVSELTTGNEAKLALVAALGHDPRLLLLDEPTSGLDPIVRAEVLDVLWEILEDGERAIFYSTHVLSDISRLADELIFLKAGRVSQRSDRDALEDDWRRITFRSDRSLRSIDGVVRQRASGSDQQVISSDHRRTVSHLQELGVENIETARLTVDEITVEILRGS